MNFVSLPVLFLSPSCFLINASAGRAMPVLLQALMVSRQPFAGLYASCAWQLLWTSLYKDSLSSPCQSRPPDRTNVDCWCHEDVCALMSQDPDVKASPQAASRMQARFVSTLNLLPHKGANRFYDLLCLRKQLLASFLSQLAEACFFRSSHFYPQV